MSVYLHPHRVHMCTLLCTSPGFGKVAPPHPGGGHWTSAAGWVHTYSPVGVCTLFVHPARAACCEVVG